MGQVKGRVCLQLNSIEPRISNAENFARQNRGLLLRHTHTQTDIDISLGILPFEQEMVERSIVHEVDDSLQIRLPTPEDLIIMKVVGIIIISYCKQAINH